jgi:hypothetical protein
MRSTCLRSGEEKIETTFNHPFWVSGEGWTEVKDLEVGDLLEQSDGDKLEIDAIEIEERTLTVYNMTVANYSTYFVSDLDIWVHNTGDCERTFTANDVVFSNKFVGRALKQVEQRGWSKASIANARNNPVKTSTSYNKYTGNSVTNYYINERHYVAFDDVTGKVVQIADLNDTSWKNGPSIN